MGKSDEISSWMYEMLDKQGSKSITDDPVLTVSEITIKTKELTILINPIMHKPKPKPKKKEGDEKAADEKTVDMEEKPTDSQTEAEPMQTDEVYNIRIISLMKKNGFHLNFTLKIYWSHKHFV